MRLDLEPDDHKLLRRVAAAHDASMASYAREILVNHLQDEASRLGLKT